MNRIVNLLQFMTHFYYFCTLIIIHNFRYLTLVLIYKYILKAHVGPFIFSVFTLMSVFLLQFFMKFADKLIGKGLSSWVIIQLVTYNLAWMLILVIPMSVLISTLMAFGKLSQDNEIAVLKASGMSLYKMLIGPILGSLLIAILLDKNTKIQDS